MTNDTTTLNGALRELGETMAANLTTQGVASTWDEGLTTLAGKILDIQGGGSGYDGISLTGDKSILSAADSEYVTLTAQLMNGQSSAAVSGETVSFKVYKASDDTLIDTLTDDTNSSGVATVSYYGEGTGDIYIKSNVGSVLSDPYLVEDCIIYDNATGDKKSKYSYSNVSSLTFNSDHYEVVTTTTNSSSNYYAPIYIADMADLPGNYEISLDYKLTTTSARQGGFNISDAHITTYSGTNELLVGGSDARTGAYYRVNGSVTHYNNQTALPRNTYVSLYLKVEGTTATFSVKNGDTVLYSNTQTLSNISNWKKFNIIFGGVAQTGHFKNLKIKQL